MFLHSIGANDERFRTVKLKQGLNLLVADKTETSDQGDSRNGTGKSSFIRILRYLLGGSLSDELKATELENHVFNGVFELSTDSDAPELVRIERPVKPQTKMRVTGWSHATTADLHVDEWRDLASRWIFRLPYGVAAPTPGNIWGQLIRTYFDDPRKSFPTDSGWVTGAKLGFLLGLSAEVLSKAGEVEQLRKQRTAIRSAVREGALGNISLDEADLRAQLIAARRKRDQIEAELRSFRVDEQYGEHQTEANTLTVKIRDLNDEALALERRKTELDRSIEMENGAADEATLSRLVQAYQEVGLVFQSLVPKRYDEVAKFHASVVRNRQHFLQEELNAVVNRLNEIASERSLLDTARSRVLSLLNDSVAMATFVDAQAGLSIVQGKVNELERQLESAVSFNQIDSTIAFKTAETVAAVRNEVQSHEAQIENSIALFNELGREIYDEHEASLLISASPTGLLTVDPHISGDASEGIKGVETFLLDILCLVTAIKAGRAPRILVHDSHLFDSVDHRQVASCLNVGARLAEQHGFQYIVTMNSDFLKSVIDQSEGAFDSRPYELDLRLEDRREDGGLFGFKFDQRRQRIA